MDTDTTLCKETIEFLFKSLTENANREKANQLASHKPLGDWDRGYQAGLAYAIRELFLLTNV